jgi:hypothetical protein
MDPERLEMMELHGCRQSGAVIGIEFLALPYPRHRVTGIHHVLRP